MKKARKILAFSAAFAAAAGLSGCDSVSLRALLDLYRNADRFSPDDNTPPVLYASPEYWDDYEPDANVEPDVYGPPEFWDEYEPETNVEPDVYGPPEYWDDYDADDNVLETLYGPPEFMGEDADD